MEKEMRRQMEMTGHYFDMIECGIKHCWLQGATFTRQYAQMIRATLPELKKTIPDILDDTRIIAGNLDVHIRIEKVL